MAWTVDGLSYDTRIKLTVDQTKIDTADLTDFPVLVKLTSTNFDFSHANADGFDIRFTAADGSTLLKYERERHDQANSLAEYWVKIPTVDYDADTDFYMYYRTTDTADGADPTNVWDANYKMVHHLTGAAYTDLDDSTVNNNDVDTAAGSPGYNAAGKIANGISGTGTSNVSAPDTVSLSISGNFSVEFWVNYADILDSSQTVGKSLYSDPSDNSGFYIRRSTNTIGFGVDNNNDVEVFSEAGSIAATTWYHIVCLNDGTHSKIYINGTQSGSDAYCAHGYGDNTVPFYIGKMKSAGGMINGTLDEVRLSSKAREAEWIKASYNSGNNTLLTYGGEDVGGATRVPRHGFIHFNNPAVA